MGNIMNLTKEKAHYGDDVQTITSLEVAEMVEKEHKNLIRDIRRYCEQLAETKIEPGDFFAESTYLDANNQSRTCYNVTKKGCELIAHKLTGVKGTKFTALYINRFHDMEEQIKSNVLPMTYRDAVAQLLESLDREEELKAQLDTSKDWYSMTTAARWSDEKQGRLLRYFRLSPVRKDIPLPARNKCGGTCLPRQSCRRNKACPVPASCP